MFPLHFELIAKIADSLKHCCAHGYASIEEKETNVVHRKIQENVEGKRSKLPLMTKQKAEKCLQLHRCALRCSPFVLQSSLKASGAIL